MPIGLWEILCLYRKFALKEEEDDEEDGAEEETAAGYPNISLTMAR